MRFERTQLPSYACLSKRTVFDVGNLHERWYADDRLVSPPPKNACSTQSDLFCLGRGDLYVDPPEPISSPFGQ